MGVILFSEIGTRLFFQIYFIFILTNAKSLVIIRKIEFSMDLLYI